MHHNTLHESPLSNNNERYFQFCRRLYNDPYKQAELWGKLKALIMHYRLDFNGSKKSLATEILNVENEGDR